MLELRIACAWCGLVLREAPGPTSHSVCAPCQSRLLEEWGIPAVALVQHGIGADDADGRCPVCSREHDGLCELTGREARAC